jgi:DNA-directed RNA polymerase subunit omega
MMHARYDKMMQRVDSRFTLVILAAKRARQINDYMNNVRKHDPLDFQTPAIDLLNEKPLSIAFNEIATGKIGYKREHDGIK